MANNVSHTNTRRDDPPRPTSGASPACLVPSSAAGHQAAVPKLLTAVTHLLARRAALETWQHRTGGDSCETEGLES
jgi:hypothetical protein